jgi:hypothetical protein
MTNAKCLTEGVNVPAIDCVLFADPKQSVVDIVQAAGRALRVNEGKKFGYIMMPLIVPDDMDLEEFTESTPFKQVARIVTALSTQDERIVEEFSLKNQDKKISERRVEISGSIPMGLNLDISSFASDIEAKYWERVGRANWRSFENAKEYIRNIGLKNQNEWFQFIKSKNLPNDIPTSPNIIYKNDGWISFGDWLGNGNIAPQLKEFCSIKEAMNFAKSKNIKTGKEWRYFSKLNNLPIEIPLRPDAVYKNNGWQNWGHFLGTGNICNRNKKYFTYVKAKKLVHKLNLKSSSEYQKEYRLGNIPSEVPFYPSQAYKNKGWENWGKFLGTNRVADQLREFKEFNDARNFVRKLEIKSPNDWLVYCKSGQKPNDIPANPQNTYKNKGWICKEDFFGSRLTYLTFFEAKEYVQKLMISNSKEWRKFCKSGKKPKNIPSDVAKIYKNDGWNGMKDFLSPQYKYLDYERAKKIVDKFKITSQKEWIAFCKSGKKPNNIPTSVANVYKNKGWKNWGEFLGTGKVADNEKKYRTFSDAKKFVQKLNIKSQSEWRAFAKTKKKPLDIPFKVERTYSQEWISWGDFLGKE